jgi:DNA-binding CsgD family transcriptional regulator
VAAADEPRPLLERDAELARVDAALAGVAAGTGRLLIVEGDPGAGKSSLLAATGARASAAGLRVLEARGGVLERASGFGVAQGLFEPVARAPRAERERDLAGAAALTAPLLGIEVGGAAGAADVEAGEGVEPGTGAGARVEPAAPGLPIDPAQARHGLYWLVANLAERGPLALLVDDVQWCDEPSLDWLLYLARRLERLPVLLVLAAGRGEPDPPGPLLGALAAEPGAEALPLAPLSEAGTEALLGATFAAPVAPEFAAVCHEWTGGNPHFVAELAAEIAAEGLEPGAAAAERLRSLAPQRVASVTLLRLGRLPAAAAALAGALAILGFEASLPHAAALAGLGEDEAVAAADALVAARLARPTPRLRFLEPLIGRVVYDDLAPARRAADHRRAAHLLDADGAAPAAVAAQLLRTDPAGDAWTVERLRDAAAAQLGTGSAAAAVPLLRRALAEPPPTAELAGLRTLLGLAESIAGDPGGLDSLRAALAASGDPLAGAQSALLLARFLVFAGQGGEAAEVAASALADLDGAEPELRAQLEAALVTAAHSEVGLRDLAAEHLGRVRERAAEDSHTGRVVAVQCAYAAAAAGASVTDTVAFARAALGNGKLLAEAPLSPDLYIVPISMLAICDELEEADARYREALAAARERGSPLAYAATAALFSLTAHLRGELAEAELLARDALRIAAESPVLGAAAGFATVHLAQTLVERGEEAAALELLGPELEARADSRHTWSREALFVAGRAHLASRRPAEALELALAAGERSEALGIENPAFLPWRSTAALALHELGEAERALELSGAEVELARRFGARRPLGIALRAQGLIAGGEEGLALLRESVAVLAESPAVLERAGSLVALGAALRRAGKRAEAREVLAAGLELAAECGALPLAERAREELGAGGARPRAQGRWDADALTISELRICRMAAEGMSNPAIAQALFVTRGTVETHLHAAYRKLSIASRRDLPNALRGYGEA